MTKVGRNAPCPCGSGLKYKRCCEKKDVAAETQRIFETFGAHEQAEMLVYDSVYQGILRSVWTAFHGHTTSIPNVETMENFYEDLYGYELDGSLIDEIVFPLSPEARARLIAIHGLKDEKIVDVPTEDVPPDEAL